METKLADTGNTDGSGAKQTAKRRANSEAKAASEEATTQTEAIDRKRSAAWPLTPAAIMRPVIMERVIGRRGVG